MGKKLKKNRESFAFSQISGAQRRGTLRQKKSAMGEHIALLSVKYNVHPNDIIQALVGARENESAVCGDLTVERRGKMRGEHIFLITKNNAVVAQFPVKEEFLFRRDVPCEVWMNTDRIRKKMAKQTSESQFTSINDLQAGMKKANLHAKVLEIPKPAQVHTQFGNTVMVANAVVGDDSGTVKLCLWEAQIGSVSVGDSIELRCAQVCMFRGEKQLRLGKNGALTVLEKAEPQKKPQLAAAQIK
jgi:replication factor A1